MEPSQAVLFRNLLMPDWCGWL
uniref:Uncharacterized protein n=1 Tax=Anguilla anguilla TaxID=7936 RepID=A0A0E9TGV0_ANGAN